METEREMYLMSGDKRSRARNHQIEIGPRFFPWIGLILLMHFTVLHSAELSTARQARDQLPQTANVLALNTPQKLTSLPDMSGETGGSPAEQNLKKLVKAKKLSEFRQLYGLDSGEAQCSQDAVKKGVWLLDENKRHQLALDGARFDLIVLPAQEDIATFDRVARLMSARWIAQAIEARTGLKVMSPELALRYLGGRVERFDDEAVRELSIMTGANIVYLFINARPYGEPQMGMAVVEVDAEGVIQRRDLRDIKQPSHEIQLESIVKDASGAIVDEMYGVYRGSSVERTASKDDSFALPVHLTDLVGNTEGPAKRAAALQLLAMLTPSHFEYERRRLFERSLLAADELDHASEYYNLLMARALFHLSRRPTAVTYLQSAKLPAEKALREFLNGNSPELEELISAIDAPIFRAMAAIELDSLRIAYDKSVAGRGYVSSLGAGWGALIDTAGRDSDQWYVPDNPALFTKINGLFPAFDKAMGDHTKGKLIAGNIDDSDAFEQLIEEVFMGSLGGDDQSGYKPLYGSALELSDLWVFYRNLAMSSLLKRFDRMVDQHASYPKAVDYIEKLKPMLEGYPTFTRISAEAVWGASKRASGAKRSYLHEMAFDLATAVENQSCAIDIDTRKAGNLRVKVIRQLKSNGKMKREKVSKPISLGGVPTNIALSSSGADTLLYSNQSFKAFKWVAKYEGWDDKKIDEILGNRFNGHPEKNIYLASRLINAGNKQQAISMLQGFIEKGDDIWDLYKLLASLYIEMGRYKDAQRVYLSYPGFKDDEKNDRVALSNHAHNAGSRLYWLGLYEEAKPLYEICASLETGANAQFASEQRLGIMDHNYKKVLSYALRRGKRYNSIYGFRDYLAFLHVVGAHELADAGFSELAPRFKDPQLWTSRFVGDRMQALSFGEMEKKAQQLNVDTNERIFLDQKIRYLLLQAVTDREFDVGALDALSSFANRSNTMHKPFMAEYSGLKKVFSPEVMRILTMKCYEQSSLCDSAAEPSLENDGHDFHLTFMDAYQSLFSGRYVSALKQYVEFELSHFARYFSLDDTLLPYLAMAASKTLERNQIEDLLGALSDIHANAFDTGLAKSVLLTGLGRDDEAIDALQAAFDDRPHTEWRPVYSWYQITLTAEWLAEQSGDRRFIDLALEWARRYQVIQPQFAWAYAFEALYAEGESERVRAAAFAEYLDPKSAWLSKVPEEIRQKGKAEWSTLNPFKINVPPSQQTKFSAPTPQA
jgi:hypothetical protein